MLGYLKSIRNSNLLIDCRNNFVCWIAGSVYLSC